MRLDHVSYAAGPGGNRLAAVDLAERLGCEFTDGGIHPRFGTRNMTLPLGHGRYLEIVEALDHPASDKAPFGQAVKARAEQGGGWLGWVVSVDDAAEMSGLENRLGRDSVPGNRNRPDGTSFRWRQLGVKGLMSDPQLPFFIEWDGDSPHPSDDGRSDVSLRRMEIAGDPDRVADWIGAPAESVLDDVDIVWTGRNGTPGLTAVTFETAHGEVRI